MNGPYYEYDGATKQTTPGPGTPGPDADGWYRIRLDLPHVKPTIYLNGLLYKDPKRGHLYNWWLRMTWRFRHWRATRYARGAS